MKMFRPTAEQMNSLNDYDLDNLISKTLSPAQKKLVLISLGNEALEKFFSKEMVTDEK